MRDHTGEDSLSLMTHSIDEVFLDIAVRHLDPGEVTRLLIAELG